MLVAERALKWSHARGRRQSRARMSLVPYGMDTSTFTPDGPVTSSRAAPSVIVRQRVDSVAVLDYSIVSS